MGQQGSSPSEIRYPAWQNEYQAALLELDPKKLLERVHAAETAIFNRLQELAQSPNSPDQKAERQAIEDALSGLKVIKRDKLDFPDWETK
jgi:hypothetical protein